MCFFLLAELLIWSNWGFLNTWTRWIELPSKNKEQLKNSMCCVLVQLNFWQWGTLGTRIKQHRKSVSVCVCSSNTLFRCSRICQIVHTHAVRLSMLLFAFALSLARSPIRFDAIELALLLILTLLPLLVSLPPHRLRLLTKLFFFLVRNVLLPVRCDFARILYIRISDEKKCTAAAAATASRRLLCMLSITVVFIMLSALSLSLSFARKHERPSWPTFAPSLSLSSVLRVYLFIYFFAFVCCC